MDDNTNKEYSLDNIPADAEMYTGQSKDYAPIDPAEIYQIQISKATLRDNPFYRPDEKKKEDQGSKYQFSFEFVILNEGEFYGRRLWDTTGLAFKPTGKRGPTKLYKIITKALKVSFTWDECASFASDIKTFLKNLGTEIVGKQLRVAIENEKKQNGKIRTKITSYNEVKENLPEFNPEKEEDLLTDIPAKKGKKKLTEDVDPDSVKL